MANSDAPFGLRPVRYISGAPYNGACNRYKVPSTDSTAAMFIGDPVNLVGTADADGTPHVGLATVGTAVTTDRILGAIVGFEADINTSLVYRADDTTRYVYVADDPDLLFEMQEDGNMGVTATGGTCQIVSGSGNTYTGTSGYEIDSSEAAQTATDQLLIIGPSPRPDNDPTAANAKWLVKINMHARAFGVAGIS